MGSCGAGQLTFFLSHGSGSTATVLMWTSKCRHEPNTYPVEPTSPMYWPSSTQSPTSTRATAVGHVRVDGAHGLPVDDALDLDRDAVTLVALGGPGDAALHRCVDGGADGGGEVLAEVGSARPRGAEAIGERVGPVGHRHHDASGERDVHRAGERHAGGDGGGSGAGAGLLDLLGRRREKFPGDRIWARIPAFAVYDCAVPSAAVETLALALAAWPPTGLSAGRAAPEISTPIASVAPSALASPTGASPGAPELEKSAPSAQTGVVGADEDPRSGERGVPVGWPEGRRRKGWALRRRWGLPRV